MDGQGSELTKEQQQGNTPSQVPTTDEMPLPSSTPEELHVYIQPCEMVLISLTDLIWWMYSGEGEICISQIGVFPIPPKYARRIFTSLPK